jgi:hypothetical protein
MGGQLHQIQTKTHFIECFFVHSTENRDRGKLRSYPPPTPPDMRVRIRRFGGLSDRFHS